MTKVAKLAGVSQATVSRVINRQPGVSNDTVRDVLSAIQTIGYKQPKALQKKRRSSDQATGTIVMVVGKENLFQRSEIFLRLQSGAIEALAKNKYKLVLAEFNKDREFISPFSYGDVDGVIMGASCTEAETIQYFGRVPIVWVASRSDVSGDHILHGNEVIGRLAADYLKSKDCESLIFFSHTPSFSVYRSRWAAFRSYAEDFGLEYCLIAGNDKSESPKYEPEKLRKNLDRMVDNLISKNLQKPGIFVPDDIVTATLYPLLYQKNITPGKDVHIISCCNEQSYLMGLYPRPATIDLGYELMGSQAASQLLTRIQNPSITNERSLQVAIAPELVK